MAGKTNFESGNDFDFGNDLDIPDFAAFGEKESKRSARSVATGLSKAALKGVIGDQGLTESSFIRRTIRSTLPKGYGTALDIADEASTTLRSLYNETAREMKPLLNDMKRVVQRMEEPIDKYLPKSLAERLKKFSVIESSGDNVDPEAQRESMLQAQLAEALKFQIGNEAKRQQADDSRSRIREGIDNIRHKDSMGQLNAIRLATSQLAAYQNNVTAGYHRKSLELQFRSFYALRDIVVEQRRMNEVATEAFQKIIKNTGLPDYVKLTESDRLKQATRNRFGDAAMSFGNGLIGDRANFIHQTGENVRKVLGQRVKDFAWSASQGIQGLDSASDLMSLAEMSGMRPEEILAQGASGMAAQHYGTKFAKWLKKSLPRDGRIGNALQKGGRIGNMIQYHATNLPGKAKNWAEGFDELPGYLKYLPGPLQNVLRDAINMQGGMDRTIQKDRLKDMQGPAIFSRQVAKSITEVIPGYLARIFREIQILRTGDEGIELTQYDFSKNSFSKKSDVRKGLYNTVVNKTSSQYLNTDMEALLDEIDPDKKLSKEARMDLRKQLLKDNIHNKAGNAEHYADMFAHHGLHGREIAEHFSQRYGKSNDPDYTKRNAFASKHVAVGQGVKIAREEIQDLANAGLLDQLEDLNLIDKHGNINIDQIAGYHLDNQYRPESGQKGSLRRASKRRGDAMAGTRGAGIRHVTNNVTNEGSSYADHYDRSTAGGKQDFAEVIAAIKANSNSTILEKISETILRIEEEMKAGLVMYNAGEVHTAGTGPNGRGILDRSLRQNWAAGKESIRGAGARAWDWWKKPGWGTAQWNDRHQTLGKIKGGLQSARETVGGWISKAGDKWEDMKEVYIDGELKPRLTAWGFKAGLYYDGPITDAKRKVVKSWKEIKGSVYDEEGNLILDPSQVAGAFIRTTAGKKLIAAKNWLWDKAKQGFEGAKSGALSAHSALRAGFNKATEYLDAQDVFTKDNLETPKLQATIMRAKGYRSMHRRDKFIMTPGDIDGPVVNLSGDQVLTDNDLRTGICDRYGRPLLTGKLRLIQFGKDTISMAMQKVQNGFNMAKDFLSGKWQGFKNWFHVDGIAFSGGKTIIERLTEIRDLLDKRLPGRRKVLGDVDGDGIREGSYEDQVKKGLAGTVAHGESAEDAEKAAAAAGKGAGGMGIFGAAGAGFKALADLWKKHKGGAATAAGDAASAGTSALGTYGGLALDALGLIPGGKILRGAGRGLRGLFRGGSKYGKIGLEGAGDLLKAAGAARAVGKGGFVGTAEALRAAKGIKASQAAAKAAEEIMESAMMSGATEEEARLLAQDALHGGQAAEKAGLGAVARKSILSRVGSGLAKGARGLWNAGGMVRDASMAGNKVTGSLAARGLRMGGRGALEAAKLGGRGAWWAAKHGVKEGLPWLAKDLGKNALRVGKFGGGLGLGIGLDVASSYANAHGHETVGKGLGYAGDAVTGWGLASSAAGLMGIEGGALGLAGAAGGTLLSIIASPVVLGAAAAGLAGYGAYKLYKYATKKRLTKLSTLRYIQYGWSQKDPSHADAVFDLENLLEPNVSFHPNGVPSLSNKGLKEKDLLDGFGVNIEDKAATKKWLEWFTLRFKPIFLTHMQAMKKASDQAKSLKDTESFKPAQQRLYVQVASYPGGPYKYMTSPFPSDDGLQTSDSDVAEYAKGLLAGIEVDVKKDPDGDKPVNQPAAKTVAEMAAAATTAQLLHDKPKQVDWQGVKDLKGVAQGSQTGTSAAGAMITMKGQFDAAHLTAGSTLDGISTIRYKTYGLKDMNIEKVKNLLVLENAVLKDIDINDKFVAVYKGDVKKLFAEQAPAFGVSGTASTGAYDWLAWFNLRFLPTYLNYLTAVCGTTKKSDPRVAALSLKPDDAVSIAATVKTSSGKNGSVWAITQMPWPNYEANTEISSTDDNYAGLQERATKSKLDEIKGVPGAGDTDSKKGSANGSGEQSWISKKWDALTTGKDGKPNWLGKAANAVGSVFGGAGKTLQDSASVESGVGIAPGGPGTGGKVNDLPDPKGDGSWAALKDLIIAGSKMVGVDPSIMATMAAIESGFRATVKAGTSSATGLYQFITGTWNDTVKKYGAKYGLGPNAQRTDPKANMLMGAEFTKANMETLRQGLGRNPTPGEIYAAHFLGAGTALKLFKSDQNTIAAQVLPQQAAANRNIFYDGSSPRTVGGVIAYLNGLVANKGKQFGISTAGGEALVANSPGPIGAKGDGTISATGAKVPGAGDSGGDRFSANSAPPQTAPGAASTPASQGTGAPMGFGGSTGPTPNAAGPAPGGSAPRTVFDAMGGNGKPATAGPTPTQSATPPKAQDPFAVPNMGAGAAMGTGFSPNAARSATDLVATQRSQAAASATQVPDGGIAAQHLGVSKEMLAQLQLLVKFAAQAQQPAAAAKPQPPEMSDMQSTIATRKAQAAQAQPMKAAPISVAKPNYNS